MEVVISDRSTDWVVIISLIASAFLVLANFVNSQRTRSLMKILFSIGGDELALSFNQDKPNTATDLLLLLASVTSMPLAIIATKVVFLENNLWVFGWAEYLRMMLLTVIFLVFKNLLASIIGWVFSLQEELIKAQNIFLAHFSWLSISAALLSLLVYFSPWPIGAAWLLILLFSLGLLTLILKTSSFTFRIGIPIPYFILYLCALEIIPISYLFFLV